MNMRRSVRFFRTDIIPDIQTVINCIKTANTAPSGAHLSMNVNIAACFHAIKI